MSQQPTWYTVIDSSLGPILLARTAQGLTHINFQAGTDAMEPHPDWRRHDEAFADARKQLDAYLSGQRMAFDLPLAPEGTPFQKRVWEALRAIPYGETASYGDVAGRLGRPGAARAVGAANGRNPLPIVVPCHRVIGSDGSLTGYGGGLSIKKALLTLEQRTLQPTLLAEA